MSKKHNTGHLENELDQSRFFMKPNPSSKTGKDLNKDLDKDLDKDAKQDVKQATHTRSHNLPTADEVEEMVFRLRKEPKIRINADFPEDWKKELDEYAHTASVGKYHLVMYAVGKMLGKI